MARGDLYGGAGGLVVDLQSELLEVLSTRVVAPLLPLPDAPPPARRLNPVFRHEGADLVLVTQYLAAVRLSELGPVLGRLDDPDNRIGAAVDMVFVGF